MFSRKDSLKRHASVCKGVPPRTCLTCKRTFSTNASKSRHVLRGKCAPPAPKPDESEEDGATAATRTTVNNNIEQQNNLTININAFQREDIEHLLCNKRRMDGYVSSAYRAIPNMVRDVYFDAERPANRTVRYPNVRAPHMLVATTDGGWEFRDKTRVLRDIVETNMEHLGGHAVSRDCCVHPFALQRFRECQQLLEAFMHETGSGTRAAEVWKRVSKEVELVILSNRRAEG